MKTLILTIGPVDYTISELTLGQIEDIDEVLSGAGSGGATPAKEVNRRVVQIALSEDHPDLKLDRKTRGLTVKSLAAAARAVLVFGEWIAANKEEPKGEGASQ